MSEILKAAGKTFLRELGEHTAKKAGETIVSEALKAGIEIWKRRRIRQDEYEFAEWKKERSKEEKEEAKAAGASTDAKKPAEEAETPEEAPAEDSDSEKPGDEEGA